MLNKTENERRTKEKGVFEVGPSSNSEIWLSWSLGRNRGERPHCRGGLEEIGMSSPQPMKLVLRQLMCKTERGRVMRPIFNIPVLHPNQPRKLASKSWNSRGIHSLSGRVSNPGGVES